MASMITAMALSPDTFVAVPNESWVMYKEMANWLKASVRPTIGKKGKADTMAPPGAPGAATIAIPNTMTKAAIVPIEIGIEYIIKMAVTQDMMVIIEPARWIVAHSGTTKLAICSETPFFRAISTFVGMVAADDWVPAAVNQPGI